MQEHLVSLDEPASEAGQEALLRQEQAKIIRFERQAEEFLNAVFYRKGWFYWGEEDVGNSLCCGPFACNVGIKDLMFMFYVQYFSVIFIIYIYQGYKLTLKSQFC